MTNSLWAAVKSPQPMARWTPGAEFGLNVQELRRARGLSQEELAHRAEVHQTYLSGVERGKRNPSIMVLARIAAGLDADLDELTRRR